MKNIALRLMYDGSRYHGWQTQKKEITVQQTLEQAIEKAGLGKVHVTGCGRTDAGVHALRYCANFKSECRIPLDKLPLAINSYLPADIAVRAACEAEENFNAIGSCIKKEYIYKIHNSNLRDPFLEKRACFYPQRLDVEKMNAAAHAFEGTHDFAAVRSVGTETKTTVRTVWWCGAEREGDLITVRVCASAQTGFSTTWRAPWSERWSTPPTESWSRRISPCCWKKATEGLPARRCRPRACISTASGTRARWGT